MIIKNGEMGKWGNFMFLTKLYNTVIHSFQYTESTGHNVFLTLLIIFTGLFILSFIKHILQKMTKPENKQLYTDTSDSSLMLLSNLELESLDLAPSGIENTTVDARRFLYQTDYTNIGERTSITESPFLYGTFLSFSSLTQTPETASLDQDCVLIAHKSSLDNNASWLLSYVSISKKEILWTVDTKATAISNYYMPDSTHILLFCQNGDGTINMHSNTNYLSYVSLENGSATTYDFLYHDFSH